ncbi:single-stranded-DNA-specific exonuclease C-terminal domain-containing protein [Cohnella rhizosphaerae]|uniref:Single-stranded-DNA-specific exonuclease C-terminal domain-containing protein n=1 Tax=Cohnella rhizosphaerae TaxID=1457232 RepID=A0A9X4QVS5_9BACL|nr:single-stranded-DNA-specific exonuclease C-terminal domain-containing protein [Cohnella rhizosphaerae]MDG0813671.1 single-stranded-DNA-specific exonuclease C-terminal domain-containing protein [Cohnella rhizosphaerae]
MTMRTERVAALGEKLSALADSWLTADDWVPRKKADLVCRASELTLEAADQLRALEPCGIGNPAPRFVLRGAEVIDAKAMGKDSRHLRVVLGQGGRKLEAVCFGRGADCGAMLGSGSANVLGELSVNEWNGSKRVQLMLQDWQPAALPVHDRRHEADWRSALRTLTAATGAASLLAVAASETALAELQAATGDGAELIVASYAEAAAAATGAKTLRLALIDLPEAGDALEGLRGLLAGCVVEEIHLLSSGRASSGSRSRPQEGVRMPGREQFGEVYGLMRRKGSWIETPDGFLRQVAQRTGRTLADIVMMQDVFEELGFLRRSRASVEIVAQPPKRQLEESARYRKALLRAEAEALAAMSPADLRNWLRALAEGNDGKRLRSSV